MDDNGNDIVAQEVAYVYGLRHDKDIMRIMKASPYITWEQANTRLTMLQAGLLDVSAVMSKDFLPHETSRIHAATMSEEYQNVLKRRRERFEEEHAEIMEARKEKEREEKEREEKERREKAREAARRAAATRRAREEERRRQREKEEKARNNPPNTPTIILPRDSELVGTYIAPERGPGIEYIIKKFIAQEPGEFDYLSEQECRIFSDLGRILTWGE